MVKIIRCCDICGSELSTKEIETPFGVVEITRTFKCKEWDVSNVMPDLCEPCALKIDLAVTKLRAAALEGEKNG